MRNTFAPCTIAKHYFCFDKKMQYSCLFFFVGFFHISFFLQILEHLQKIVIPFCEYNVISWFLWYIIVLCLHETSTTKEEIMKR
jgi:hypothetical protein